MESRTMHWCDEGASLAEIDNMYDESNSTKFVL